MKLLKFVEIAPTVIAINKRLAINALTFMVYPSIGLSDQVDTGRGESNGFFAQRDKSEESPTIYPVINLPRTNSSQTTVITALFLKTCFFQIAF